MFSTVNFWFSSDGKEYHEAPETFQMLNDPKMTVIPGSSNEKGGRNRNSALISIPLQLRVGKFVKMNIKPQSKWLLLSEITFDTGIITDFIAIIYSNYIQDVIIL